MEQLRTSLLPIADSGPIGAADAGETADARYLVDCIADADRFDAFRRPLMELACQALEPSLAAEFAWTKAALAHLVCSAAMGRVALIWRHSAGGHGDPLQLVGAFSLETERVVPGLPLRVVRTWRHLFSFSGMPLVHRQHAVDVLAAFFKWVFGTGENAASLRLDQVPVSGLFADVLYQAAAAAGLPVRRLDTHERAVLAVPDSVDDYLAQALPRKRRKEFRRLRARLGEQGKLEVRQFKPGDDLMRWLNEFYALEGRGWKGRAGTSLSCDPAWSGFFDVAFGELEAGGDVLIWKLTLDGAPVAMILGAGSGRRAWLFKIAHDEHYARYSPGVLVVLDAMEALARSGEFDMIDSCAQADHPMINHLWRERLQLHDVMIGLPGQAAPVFETLYLLTRFKRATRALAKQFYRQFFKGVAK